MADLYLSPRYAGKCSISLIMDAVRDLRSGNIGPAVSEIYHARGNRKWQTIFGYPNECAAAGRRIKLKRMRTLR